MKQTLPAILLASLVLSGCGNPASIAYIRGRMLERQGDLHWANENPITKKGKQIYVEAVDQFTAAIKLQPRYLDAYHERGLCNWRMGELDDAFEDLSEAIALAPKDPTYWRERAELSRDLSRYDQSIKDFDEALRLSPNDEQAITERAETWAISGKPQECLKNLDNWVPQGNVTEYQYLARASAYRRLHDGKSMQREYEKAVSVSPKHEHDSEIYLRRGYGEFVLADYEGAARDLASVLVLSKWQHRSAPYAVIVGVLSNRLHNTRDSSGAANELLESAIAHYQLPVGSTPDAGNAEPASDWPFPAIQYLHGDITAHKLIASAGADGDKLTEANCYIGLANKAAGNEKDARTALAWVVQHGNKNFIEYEAAQNLAAKQANPKDPPVPRCK